MSEENGLSDLPNPKTGNVIETMATGDSGDFTLSQDDKFEMHFNYLGWP